VVVQDVQEGSGRLPHHCLCTSTLPDSTAVDSADNSGRAAVGHVAAGGFGDDAAGAGFVVVAADNICPNHHHFHHPSDFHHPSQQ